MSVQDIGNEYDDIMMHMSGATSLPLHSRKHQGYKVPVA